MKDSGGKASLRVELWMIEIWVARGSAELNTQWANSSIMNIKKMVQ